MKKNSMRGVSIGFACFACFACLALVLVASCTKGGNNSKVLQVDGSSTVYPVTEAVAEEMRKVHPKINVVIGISGTGGGFKKFLGGTTHINNASRQIKPNEIERSKKNNISYLELPVAYDGISIVVHKDNTWADYLSVKELKKIWDRNSPVKTWRDVRPSWPNKPLQLYGPGGDSGTFDYFTKNINGKSQRCRSDYTKSEDDNVLVIGVANSKYSLGFFGYAYYKENKDKIRAVPIANKKAPPVAPAMESIRTGSYKPLSRPIFIYVNMKEAKKIPGLRKFVQFYLQNVENIASEVGYVPMSGEKYRAVLKLFEQELAKQ